MAINTNVIYQIVDFFNRLDDLLDEFIDRVELTPVRITKNAYITGFRRTQSSYADIEVHIKEMRETKMKNIHGSVTDEGGWMMMEPDGEIWVNSSMLSDSALAVGLEKFTKVFAKLSSFHLMTTKYKDDGDNFSTVEIALFESKKVACKEALAMRKKHKNVTTKFETRNSQGEIIDRNQNTQQEMADFELVTCAVEN